MATNSTPSDRTIGLFNNRGGGSQNFSKAKINSGAHSGDNNQGHNQNNSSNKGVINHGDVKGGGSGSAYNGGAHNFATTFN